MDVADGRVWIRMADYFRRPLRLSPQEGLALVSAGSALLSVPGADPDGALATALAKLEDVLGVGADDGLDIELAQVTPAVLGTVRQAADRRRKVELDYYSFGRDGHSTRVVQPWRVFNASGQWYLSGWCERADGERLFRVDRISRAEILAAGFDPTGRSGPGPTALYHPGPDDPRRGARPGPAGPLGRRAVPQRGRGGPGPDTVLRVRAARPASGPGWSVCCCGPGRTPGWSRATPRRPWTAAARLLARYRA